MWVVPDNPVGAARIFMPSVGIGVNMPQFSGPV